MDTMTAFCELHFEDFSLKTVISNPFRNNLFLKTIHWGCFHTDVLSISLVQEKFIFSSIAKMDCNSKSPDNFNGIKPQKL